MFLLVVWSLATALFPATYPGLSGSTYLLMALVATALFFASILVHELSHTLRARREGVQVREITLWLLGGVSRAEEPLPTPGAEFRMVTAGPLASAAQALGFLGLAALAGAAGLPDGVRGVPDYLARSPVDRRSLLSSLRGVRHRGRRAGWPSRHRAVCLTRARGPAGRRSRSRRAPTDPGEPPDAA